MGVFINDGALVGSIYGQLKLDWSSFQSSLAAVNQQLYEVGSAFAKAGREWTTTGRTLTTSFTLPVAALGIASGKTFMDFETSMSRIEGLVGLSKETVTGLTEEIKKLSPDVGKAPKELADALYFITSAGIPAAAAMDVLTSSAKASAAGLGTTSVIADAVTSAMNAYASTGMTAAHATDILVAAVKFGKLEADALAPALGQVISVASTLGISFDQVAGAMAAMSRTGVDASQSATALTAIMSMLMKPTTQGTELLIAHGLSLKGLRDMAAQPGGLIEVLRTLDKTFQGDDEAMATIIPNIRALRGVLNLLTQDSSVIDEVLQGVTNSTGAADAAFQAYADTSKAKLDAAIAGLKVSLIEVGGSIMPMVADAAKGVTAALKDFAGWWTNLTKGQQQFIVKSAAVVAAIGPLIWGFGVLLTSIGAISTALSLMTAPVGIVVLAIAGLVAIVAEAIVGLKDLDIIMNKPISEGNIKYYKEALDVFDAETKKTVSGMAYASTEWQKSTATYEAQRAAERLDLSKNVQREIDGVRGVARDKQAAGELAAIARTTKAKTEAAAAQATQDAELAGKIYELTHTTLQNELHAIDVQAKADLAAGKDKVQVATWVKLAKTAAEKETADAAAKLTSAAAAKAVKLTSETAAKVLQINTELNDQIYKLNHTTVEGQIYDLDRARDVAIENGGSKLKADEVYALASRKVYADAAQETADKQVAIEKEAADKRKAIHDALTQTIIDNYQVQENAAIKDLEGKRDDLTNALDLQIGGMKTAHDATAQSDKMADLAAKFAHATTVEDRIAAEKALMDEASEQAYKNTLTSLEQQRQAVVDDYADRLTKVNVYYDGLLTIANVNAEAQKILANTTQTDIIAILESHLPDFAAMGAAAGNAYWNDFTASIGIIKTLMPTTATLAGATTSLFGGGSGRSLMAHASGGYFTTPHIGLIAENGPEAVVPQSQFAAFAHQVGGGDTAAGLRQLGLKLDMLTSAVRQVAPGVGSVINGLGRA